jgi:hypothetical protein
MPMKIVLTVTKSKEKGKEYEYTQKETVFVGRAADNQVSLSEASVSRHHTLLDIAPPRIVGRDVGSLNGTYHNGRKMGSRPKGTSPEEGRKLKFDEFELRSGDTIGLGGDVELSVSISIPDDFCERCGVEAVKRNELVLHNGHRYCSKCYNEMKNRPDDGNSLPLINGQPDAVKNVKAPPGYTYVRKIAEGGMGSIHLVRNTSGKTFAMKTLVPRAYYSEEAVQRFEREAKLLGQLNHPNIVRQLDFGQIGAHYYTLTEYCEMGDLAQLVRKSGGKLLVPIATKIILQALTALEYAHSASVKVKLADGSEASAHGIVHRDIKPQNILLGSASGSQGAKNADGDYTVKLADFGIAKAFETSGQSGLTHTGTMIGTLAFMPKQQALNFRYSKPDVDVWAIAATYYYLLTGYSAKCFIDDDDLLEAIEGAAVPILKRNPNVPRKLAEVIDRALIDNPEIGVKSISEFKGLVLEAV